MVESDEMRVAYRTCPLCEATCGLEIQLDANDRVRRIRGDREDVFSGGFICPKGTTLGAFHDDPDRLRQPLIRADDGTLVETDWETAFERVSELVRSRLADVPRESAAIYLGNPAVHSLDLLLYSRSITEALGTRTIFSASTVDQRPREVASGLIYGSPQTIPVPDIDRTDALVLLGANPLVSNGSLATAPDWPGRIDALIARGGTMTVIDPIRTKTAARANRHIPIRPTSDALLLAAIATDIATRGLARPEPADAERLRSVTEHLALFTPESVAEATGIEPRSIRSIVDELTTAERPCVYGRLGTTVTPFGTTASWLIDIVNALLGAMDRPGGTMFPTNAAGSANTRRSGPHGPEQALGRRKTSTGRPIELGEHPVAAMAEEIEAQSITFLITVAGNPVLSCPDSERLDAALPTLDAMISLDCYLNETTAHADVILPPPSHLQRPHFDLAFMGLSVRNVANWSPAVLPLDEGQLPEWVIALRLASILRGGAGSIQDAENLDDGLVQRSIERVVTASSGALTADLVSSGLGDRTGPERLVDLQIRTGPHGDLFGIRPDGLTLAALEAAPHGIDLGPLEPRMPDVLATPSGRPEYDHPDLIGDLGRLAEFARRPRSDSLQLVNRRTLRSNNSWMHNLEILVKGKPRCTVQIHPADAADRGVQDGAPVRIISRSGEIELPAAITEDVMPGVVSVPHGWGHDHTGSQLHVAERHAGANVNVLTPGDVLDPLSGTSQLVGIDVSIVPA